MEPRQQVVLGIDSQYATQHTRMPSKILGPVVKNNISPKVEGILDRRRSESRINGQECSRPVGLLRVVLQVDGLSSQIQGCLHMNSVA